MNDRWDFLLNEFRRLGGVADNVCQKLGEHGKGIFPVNPSIRARIFTPSKLLIKKDDIYLEDKKLRIKKDKKYDREIRDFFNFYQDHFSWGSEGKDITESFEKELLLFNSNLKKLIKQHVLVDLEARHKGKWNSVIKKQFLNARAVKFKNSEVVAPLWDLVNHKVRSLPFIVNEEGISTPNYSASYAELRHSYGNQSPLKRFFSYGFFSEETIVFSVPFSINIKNLGIQIFCKGMDLNNDSMKIERCDNKIILEGLPVADINHPRLPFFYFDEILKKIGNNNIPKDILLTILKKNIDIRKKIIDESKLTKNDASDTLIKILIYEVNLISSHN